MAGRATVRLMNRHALPAPMVAQGQDTPPETPAPSASTGPDAQRQARYVDLVGRLRGRQITMEEATELFGIMQGMLRASEAARRIAAMPPAAVPAGTPMVLRPPSGAGPSSAAPDDMFLVGLLAMGAGAGLLAAMARRLGEAAPTSPPAGPGTTARRAP